jgi:hypothetical protein
LAKSLNITIPDIVTVVPTNRIVNPTRICFIETSTMLDGAALAGTFN